MSIVRIRVASSDWCPSRIVVSVSRRRSCASIQAASPSAPSRSSTCFDPSGGVAASGAGARGTRMSAAGRGRPSVSGWPFTEMSAR